MPTASPSADTAALRAARAAIEQRAAAARAIRSFFDTRGFLEVQTPVVLSTPALEDHIDAFPAGAGYLRTSPEFHMKRLAAAGIERTYQLGPCFRSGERGRLHHPEFTMLEWYRSGADYHAVLADTRGLVLAAAEAVCGGTIVSRGDTTIDLAAAWEVIRVEDAFRTLAGWDPVEAFDAERFDLDLVTRVEPGLPRGPVVLTDYPVAAAALARPKPGRPEVAERWELYIDRIELANAYSELTDPAEQRRRFVATAAGRQARGQPAYAVDTAFLAALDSGLPPCAGVALGFDRLLLVLAGAVDLDAVLPFRADEPA